MTKRNGAFRVGGWAGLLLSLMASSALAQSTATLQGSVTDAQGAALAGVKIVVHNEATGTERTTQTDVAGQYLVAALPVGSYRVEASLLGFQTRVIRPLRLEVAQTLNQNFQLGLGSVSEEVTVTSEAPPIETATSSVGQVIDRRTVQEIPLNGRHFVDLGLLIPGSVTPPQNGFLTAPLRGQGSFGLNTAGNREDTVNFMINGINLNDIVQNQITFQPSINTVQEFKVDNSTFSAEYGRSSGSIVNIATRSGTNDLHGEVFEFLRHDSLDSRNYFSLVKSPFKRNQFGANLGGPLVKDKTFFFVSYEGLRQRQGLDLNSGVLTDAQRAAVTDPVSRKLLSVIPMANSTGPAGDGRFVGTGTAPVDIDQWTGDLSHNFSADDHLHVYYVFQRDKRGEPNLQGNTIPGFGDTRQSHRQILTVNESHIISPAAVNELRLGYNRINITFTPNTQLNPADFGINDGITTALGLPQITIQGLGLNFGGPSGFPQGRTDTTYVVSDTVSYLVGRNSLKFGGEYRRSLNNNFNSDTGTFVFPSLAAFQSGQGSSFSITLGDRPSDITTGALGFFVQDNVKVTTNLTLELGLRYDWNVTPTESQNRFVVFDAQTDRLLRVGTDIAKIYHENATNFEPRVGFIWNLGKSGRTVLRGGYAKTVDQPITNLVSVTSANPPLATPLSFAGPVTLANAAATARAVGLAPVSVDPNFNNATVQSFNLNVQQELTPSLGVMVGYFGSRGTDLRVERNLNQFVNGARPFPTLSASSPILPGAALGNIAQATSLGKSWYDALWVTANKRMSHGLQFNASYTFSKSLDYNSQNSNIVGLQDSTNPRGDKGLSDFDARHRFVLSAIYELPLHGNALLEGWQVGVITQAQSGNPLNIVIPAGTLTGSINSVRPDVAGQLSVIGSTGQWFSNTVCDPTRGACPDGSVLVPGSGPTHFGNLGRNVVTGPPFKNTDLSLTKNTKIGGATLQFRAEVFDLFNTANYGQPGRFAVLNSTAYGVITNTRFPTGDSGSSRQVQLAVKILF